TMSKEALNLPCPFAGQDRAHGVDEPAAGLHQLRTDPKQPLLRGYEPVEPFRRQPPPAFRIAAPRSAPRAWRIDQDEVGFSAPVCQLLQFLRRAKQSGFDR